MKSKRTPYFKCLVLGLCFSFIISFSQIRFYSPGAQNNAGLSLFNQACDAAIEWMGHRIIAVKEATNWSAIGWAALTVGSEIALIYLTGGTTVIVKRALQAGVAVVGGTATVAEATGDGGKARQINGLNKQQTKIRKVQNMVNRVTNRANRNRGRR